MRWKVRIRDKDFIGNEGWDPEFEFEVREALTDTQELSGSAEVIIHVKDESVESDHSRISDRRVPVQWFSRSSPRTR